MRRLSLLALLVLAAPAFAQGAAFDPDTVRAQPLDSGKMWLFEDPPTEYLQETYGFAPDEAWYRRARLASLRMPGCSASFVSPNGLVLTNHHCAQSHVVAVDRGGENLLDNGFYATSLGEERRVPGLTMDQLVAIDDVTDEMSAAVDAAETDAEREAAFAVAEAAVTARLLQRLRHRHPGRRRRRLRGPGGRALQRREKYSAYTFRRYRDVRLRDGSGAGARLLRRRPRQLHVPALRRRLLVLPDLRRRRAAAPAPEEYFPLSPEGIEAGSLVFVIGNPGSTSRGLTVAELEFLRDVGLGGTLRLIESRASAALRAYLATGEAAEPQRAPQPGSSG